MSDKPQATHGQVSRGIDRWTKKIIDHNRAIGKEITADQARRQATSDYSKIVREKKVEITGN